MTLHRIIRNWAVFSLCICAVFGIGCGRNPAQTPVAAQPVAYLPTPCRLDLVDPSPGELSQYRKDKVRVLLLHSFQDADMTPLLKIVANFKNLETLVVSTGASLDGCGRYLAQLQNLKALVLYLAPISKDDLRQLQTLPKLEAVGVYKFAGNDDEFEQLEEAMPRVIWDKLDYPRCRKLFDGNGCHTWYFIKNYLHCDLDSPQT